MDKEWERLYEEAMSVLNPHDVSNKMWVGSVASAVLTKKGNIYKGICIDTDGSIGMCAERNALSTMLTYGESEIKKVVSVYKDGGFLFVRTRKRSRVSYSPASRINGNLFMSWIFGHCVK